MAGFNVIWAEPSVLMPENSFLHPKVRDRMKISSQSNRNRSAPGKTIKTSVCTFLYINVQIFNLYLRLINIFFFLLTMQPEMDLAIPY
jgi:hypothetical protein